jgi:glutathione peroxidase
MWCHNPEDDNIHSGFCCDMLQEPGNSEEIVCFARSKKAEFDIFEKIDVNGNNAHPLWKYLKHKQGGTLGE